MHQLSFSWAFIYTWQSSPDPLKIYPLISTLRCRWKSWKKQTSGPWAEIKYYFHGLQLTVMLHESFCLQENSTRYFELWFRAGIICLTGAVLVYLAVWFKCTPASQSQTSSFSGFGIKTVYKTSTQTAHQTLATSCMCPFISPQESANSYHLSHLI